MLVAFGLPIPSDCKAWDSKNLLRILPLAKVEKIGKQLIFNHRELKILCSPADGGAEPSPAGQDCPFRF